MAAGLALDSRFFKQHGARDLYVDDHFRGLNAGAFAHGRHPRHYVNLVPGFMGINVALRGRGIYTDSSGRNYQIAAGTLFHRYPGVRHTTWFDPESDYAEFYVVLDDTTGRQLLEAGVISRQPVMNVGIDAVVIEGFKHLCKQIDQHEFQLPSRLVLLEAMTFIAGLYDRERRGRVSGFWERTVQDACALLEHNLDERMHIEAVAQKLGVSHAVFRKRFTQAIGMSPNDFRIRRRLESAQHLLMHESVKEVAQQLGYADPFTFSTQFKRYIGISPRAFQKKTKHDVMLAPMALRRKRRQGDTGRKKPRRLNSVSAKE